MRFSVAAFDGSKNLHKIHGGRWARDPEEKDDLVAAIQDLTCEYAGTKKGCFSSDTSTNMFGALVQGVDRLCNTKDSRAYWRKGHVLLFTDGTDRANRVALDVAQAAA